MSWAEARKKVTLKMLEKLALWRGDKDDEPDIMEDILREVIIISDDEREDAELEEVEPATASTKDRRDTAVARGTAALRRYEQHPQDAAIASSRGYRRQELVDHGPYIHTNSQDPHRGERYQVWEQTRGRLKLSGHPSFPLVSQSDIHKAPSTHSPLRQVFDAPHAALRSGARQEQVSSYPQESGNRPYLHESMVYRPYERLKKEVRMLLP